MKVLIIKLSSIGDVAQTLPALAALRKGLGPSAQIDWLVEEPASSLLKRSGLISNIIVVKPRGWTRAIRANLKTAKWLRAQGYDVVLDFQGLLKSGAWVAASRGKRKVGFANAREMSHVFLNERLPAYDPNQHAAERYLRIAQHIVGKAEPLGSLHQPPDESAAANVAQKLREAGLPDGAGYFVLSPRTRWKTKLWDDAKFAEAARKIIEMTGLYAAISCASDDKTGIDAIKSSIGAKAVNVAGAFDLAELSEAMRSAAFAITVDSGPMHIAANAGTRVIALFGPTAPWRTGPFGKGHTVIRKETSCSPCFKKTCPNVRCMNEITVDDIIEAVKKTIAK
ncbi:MAG: hypothetical protein A3J24_07740 [Deltaproteobacteria bacterium RIFCSPLOWO2_02_FULL_53_8]|nr:MAG: hypothetical protein A3J24_07740 [Deltaproteobacteria bacterium RIFCSPLOWO2_02_FULL_53_8]